MPLPILAAVTAVGKGLVVGTTKAVAAGAKVGAKAAVSSGKFFAKSGAKVARGGAKVARQGGKQVVKGAKFFKQKVGSVKEKGGNVVKKLRENATNLRDSLKSGNKNQEKLRTKKQQRKKKTESINKKREKEKQLESQKSSSDQKKTEKNLAKSPLGIFDKIFSLGGLLLGGILVNAAKGLIDKGKQFVKDNQELFDTIGNFLTGIKDAAVDFFDSFTGPYAEEGAFDDFAKFDDSGKLQSGALKKVENAYNELGGFVNAIDRALGGTGKLGNALVTSSTSSRPMPSQEELVNQTERRSGMASFREDAAENAELQRSVMEGSSSGRYGSLLDFIGSGEGGYNSMNQGTQGNSIVGSTNNASSKLGKNLTDMTIGEIMDRQAYLMNRNNPQISDYGIFAAGKYQIIPETMPGAVRGAELNRSDKFTPQNQDKLGMALIMNKRPYVGKYLRGEHNDVHGAMMELAREFASMPNPDTGRSLYGSGNKAFHSVDEVREALIKARTKPQPKITPVPNKENQARVINQPDPTDEEVATLFIQRVNTIQYVPVPVTA